MLETSLKWFTLIAVSLVAVSPLLYIFSERTREAVIDDARGVLEGIKRMIEIAHTSQGETRAVLRWGEDLPRTLSEGEVEIIAYPGYLKLLSSGKVMATVEVVRFHTYPCPFLYPWIPEVALTGAQWHVPPLHLKPSEPIIITSRMVGGRMEVFLSTPLSEFGAFNTFFNSFQLVSGREILLKKGGELEFEVKREMVVGKGYVVEFWKGRRGAVYGCVQWAPVEALYGQVRNRVEEVEYLRLSKGDVARLTFSSGLYTITFTRGVSPGPAPE